MAWSMLSGSATEKQIIMRSASAYDRGRTLSYLWDPVTKRENKTEVIPLLKASFCKRLNGCIYGLNAVTNYNEMYNFFLIYIFLHIADPSPLI